MICLTPKYTKIQLFESLRQTDFFSFKMQVLFKTNLSYPYCGSDKLLLTVPLNQKIDQ